MRRAILKWLAMTAVLAGTGATVALGAPVAGKPPTISGKPAYQQTLTCDRGTWSADAVSFSYAWAISGGLRARGPDRHTDRHLDGKSGLWAGIYHPSRGPRAPYLRLTDATGSRAPTAAR